MRIIVDAMGGDHAPEEIVKGCLDALRQKDGFELELVGDSQRIEALLGDKSLYGDRLQVVHTPGVITNDDKPTEAIKRKTDSSMVVGLRRLRDKSGHVFISAGSTGALLTGSLLIAGRIKGVNRPALAPVLPSACGGTMLIDAGMNTVLRPINYLQFAIMGSTYMKEARGVTTPRVGLVNMGTEAGKGNAVVQEAHGLLSESGLLFIGNIEGRDITAGKVDVAVCDGFTGNAMLKMMEGTGRFFLDHMKEMYGRNLFTKMAAMVVRSDLRAFKKKADPEEVGGTPILGVNGVVFKCHGNTMAKGVTNTILNACSGACLSVSDQLRVAFSVPARS